MWCQLKTSFRPNGVHTPTHFILFVPIISHTSAAAPDGRLCSTEFAQSVWWNKCPLIISYVESRQGGRIIDRKAADPKMRLIEWRKPGIRVFHSCIKTRYGQPFSHLSECSELKHCMCLPIYGLPFTVVAAAAVCVPVIVRICTEFIWNP